MVHVCQHIQGDEKKIEKAVGLITDILQKNKIPVLEGAMAMMLLLETLKREKKLDLELHIRDE